MQVFGGNRKDYLESVNLFELIEAPCSFIAISLAQRAAAAFTFYWDWDFLTDKSFKLEFSWWRSIIYFEETARRMVWISQEIQLLA